ncbi:MAG: hypothetical protein RB292_03490 [Patescibacteria group bacterium]|nr:hypothetical protein [Patescibacteria group bacterium]
MLKKSKEFATGESRYCQKCGRESHHLITIADGTKGIDQLKYCPNCAEKFKRSKKTSDKTD